MKNLKQLEKDIEYIYEEHFDDTHQDCDNACSHKEWAKTRRGEFLADIQGLIKQIVESVPMKEDVFDPDYLSGEETVSVKQIKQWKEEMLNKL